MSTLKKSSIFLAVIFTATFFSQCTLKEDIAKITDAAKNLKILIGTPEFNALTHFEIKDIKSREVLVELCRECNFDLTTTIIPENIDHILLPVKFSEKMIIKSYKFVEKAVLSDHMGIVVEMS